MDQAPNYHGLSGLCVLCIIFGIVWFDGIGVCEPTFCSTTEIN